MPRHDQTMDSFKRGYSVLRYSIFVVLSLIACTPNHLNHGCTTIKKGSFPVLTTPDSMRWSIVDLRQIDNHCLRDEFVYSGSYGEYHLLFWANDAERYNGVEHNFAILKGTYAPHNQFDYRGQTSVNQGDERALR